MRRRTGTAHRRLKSEAANGSLDELYGMSVLETIQLMARMRWGSHTYMTCPHCNTQDEHYWRHRDKRWKCTGCGSTFSVTSKTVFADHKLGLNQMLRMAFQWANRASGHVALDIRRDYGLSYRTALVFASKLREGLVRGFNTGVLTGVVEMDGADVNGRRHKEKRNKPQGGRAAGKPTLPGRVVKPQNTPDPETGEIMGPDTPVKHHKRMMQPADRRIVLVIRQRGRLKGRGAVATRVCTAISESSKTVTSLAQRFTSASSKYMTDEDPSYASFDTLFAAHGTVNHSKTYTGPNGENNNQAESFNKRLRRAEKGTYLNISNKYLTDYAVESAWREDLREPSSLQRLTSLLKHALGVGQSHWWRGYWQGKYRGHELLVEGKQDAKPRGMKKGAKRRVPR